MSDILAFAIIALFLVISPGPNIVLILKTVSTQGRYAGLFNVSGFILAAYIHGALSMLGLSALIVQSAELFFAVKVVGSVYLLYLGFKTIRQTYTVKTAKPDIVSPSVTINNSALKYFGEGFLTQMLNPKGSVFYLAVFPQFIDFQSHAYLEAFLLVSIHTGLMAIWFGAVCLITSNVGVLRHGSKYGHWVQRCCGGLLIAFSVLLLKQEVKT